jgi:Domain of unknown function (DUF4157)
VINTDGCFAVVPDHLDLSADGGTPLPAALRETMQTAFGVDFSAVRLHEGPQPGRIGAASFATGTDIYFAPGRFRPDTRDGQFLLAHELAHVVQQAEGRVPAPRGAGLHLIADEALEDEADRMAAQAMMSAAPARHRSICIRPGGSPARVLQPFWQRLPNGTTVWTDNRYWEPALFQYVTWIWPLFMLPRGVYRSRTSPFGVPYEDPIYLTWRDRINALIGLRLDHPEDWPAEPAARIDTLFRRFSENGPWFVYDMHAGGPQRLPYADCNTLCRTFIDIARNEFGIAVEQNRELTPFLTQGRQTIDPLATGNCNDGSYWFFQNHYWVTYAGQAFDLLFGSRGAPVIEARWKMKEKLGDDGYVLADGTRIVPREGHADPGVPAGHVKNMYRAVFGEGP